MKQKKKSDLINNRQRDKHQNKNPFVTPNSLMMICANDEKFAATVDVCQNEMDIELIKVYRVLELVLLTTFALSAGDGRGRGLN